MSKRIFEAEMTAEAIASMKISCDGCGATLGENYLRKRDSIGVTLPEGKDKDGYEEFKAFHFCGEACLRGFLNKRARDSASS